MIVADTNLVAYLAFNTPMTPLAIRVRAKDRNWLAPELLRSELLSVLIKHMRRGDFDRDHAFRIYRRACLVVTFARGTNLLQLISNAMTCDCTTYDLEYITLAAHHNVKLVTADKALQVAFPEIAVGLENFLKG